MLVQHLVVVQMQHLLLLVLVTLVEQDQNLPRGQQVEVVLMHLVVMVVPMQVLVVMVYRII
tara:strand:- start:323 stop:505 length:183 start_codon:yes stop_codon:yes gene_type:complete